MKNSRSFRCVHFFCWLILYGIILPAEAEEAGTPLTALDFLDRGIEHLYQQSYQDAHKDLQTALERFKQSEDHEKQVIALMYLGLLAFEQQQYHDALPWFAQSLQLARQSENLDFQAFNLNYIGEIQRWKGEFSEALSVYQEALGIIRQLGDRQGEASMLMNIGSSYFGLSNYTDSFQFYREALTLLESLEDIQGIGLINLNLGNLYTQLGNYDSALAHYEQALSRFKEVEDEENEIRALINLGGIYEEFGVRQLQDNWTESFYLKAYHIYQNILARQAVSNSDRAITLHNSAKVLDRAYWERRDARHHKEALTLYHTSRRISESVGSQVILGKTLSNLGELHLHLSAYAAPGQHIEQARSFLLEALKIQQNIGDRANEWLTKGRLALCYERQGEFSRALNWYHQAVDLLESTNITAVSAGLTQQAAEIYQHAVQLLFRQQQFEAAFLMSERARARRFLQQLGGFRRSSGKRSERVERQKRLRAEIHNLERALEEGSHSPQTVREIRKQLQAMYVEYEEALTETTLEASGNTTAFSTLPMTVEAAQALLDDRTTLLAYFTSPSGTLAFIITRSDFQVIQLPLTEEEAQKIVIETTRPPTAAPSQSSLHAFEEGYKQLIAPLETHLTTPFIGIVPHGSLHYLPFAALKDHEQFFGDKHILFNLPSVTTLRHLPRSFPETASGVLIFGNPYAPPLPPLGYAGQELWSIGRLYGAMPYINSAATETRFKQLAGDAGILHLLAHGELNADSPLFSRIRLTPDESNDGNVEVHEVYGLKLHKAPLVVLSACDTHRGRLYTGDDIVGLTRAFLYAGASGVLSSLWAVNDRSTSFLMTQFYLHLQHNSSPFEALAHAQRTTRKCYHHPYYWAGFTLTGHPLVP